MVDGIPRCGVDAKAKLFDATLIAEDFVRRWERNDNTPATPLPEEIKRYVHQYVRALIREGYRSHTPKPETA